MPPTDTNAFLHWEVFVTPGIPIVTRDKPPDVRQTYFQAMAATLIYGVRDAVLVDTFMTVTQANALADWVAARGRNLKTIYITHGHGDHWFGVATLLERFPNAKAVATPNTVTVMRQNASPEALEGSWKASFPGQIPDRLIIAEELDGHLIDLEGHAVVASHKRPENDDNPTIIEQTRQYIRDFDRLAASTTTAQELYEKMLELYPNRVNPGWALWSSARAVKPLNPEVVP